MYRGTVFLIPPTSFGEITKSVPLYTVCVKVVFFFLKYSPIAWNEKYKDALLENPVTP